MDPYLTKLITPTVAIPEAKKGNGISTEAKMRVLAELKTLESIYVARMQFARRAGLTFNGDRDVWKVLGYEETITTRQYRDRYERGGIAGRVVDAPVKATWRGGWELIDDEDPNVETELEKAWRQFSKQFKINSIFERVDTLGNLSSYAILLLGAPGSNPLTTPLPRSSTSGKSLLYLTPFGGGGGAGSYRSIRGSTGDIDADATVKEYELNPHNARFGQPKSYQLRRVSIEANELLKEIHWTRVIHVPAEGLLDDEVFGQPALQRVWNLLDDLEKVTGGGAEAFWLRANQGLHLNVDKDMTLGTEEKQALKDQAEEYQHSLRRMLRTRGVEVNPLGSDVANFSGPADAVLTQIAGSKGIPKRILTGSEMGELASSQDRDNWKDYVTGRRENYADLVIIRPLIDRLIEYGYLPAAKGDEYTIRWSDIQVLTEEEKYNGAKAWAAVNQANGAIVFLDTEIRDKWYGLPPLEEDQLEEQRKLREIAQPPELQNPDNPEGQDEEDEVADTLRAAIEAGNKEVANAILFPALLTTQPLRETFTFTTQEDLQGFVEDIRADADEYDHHPSLEVNDLSVTVVYMSTREGEVTVKDFEAMVRAEEIAGRYM